MPIGELKITLLGLAEQGMRINHESRCLFSGFALNQNWTARGPVLKERLAKLVVEGAKFEVQTEADEPGNPAISRWTTQFEFTAGPEEE